MNLVDFVVYTALFAVYTLFRRNPEPSLPYIVSEIAMAVLVATLALSDTPPLVAVVFTAHAATSVLAPPPYLATPVAFWLFWVTASGTVAPHLARACTAARIVYYTVFTGILRL